MSQPRWNFATGCFPTWVISSYFTYFIIKHPVSIYESPAQWPENKINCRQLVGMHLVYWKLHKNCQANLTLQINLSNVLRYIEIKLSAMWSGRLKVRDCRDFAISFDIIIFYTYSKNLIIFAWFLYLIRMSNFTSVHFIMWNLLLCILINIARFEKIPETVP